jgi:DNA-binding response OmpR family regulator
MTPDDDAPEQSGTVLIVDDNPASRYISGSWLRRHGYTVLEVGTGAAALELLAQEPVDLVVLDVGLPDMSGFDVCTRIKSEAAFGQPVIHLSATAIRGTDRARGLNRGADAYLTEPVEPDELVATVDAVLRYYRARAVAERLATRLTLLTAASHAMQASTTVDQLAAAISSGASAVLECPAVAVVTTTSGARVRAVTRAGETAVGPVTGEPADPLRRLARDVEPGAIVRRRLLPAEAPEGAAGWDALVSTPRTSGLPLCIAVARSALAPAEEDALAQLGHAAVLAAEALHAYADEHDLALTLQRSFLPASPPRLPGLETAVRYVPAGSKTEIGGDFYELIELDGDRLLIAIGDVAGHSIHAATVMVELRHALRAYAVDEHDPSRILDMLHRMLRRYHGAEFATLCLLVLDPARNELQIANAGHLPPLLVTAAGAEYLDVYGPMLGLPLAREATVTRALPRSWSLVLVTDGLIEEPDRDLDDALEELRAAVDIGTEPEQLCDRLLLRFGASRRDDIALLVLRMSAV